MILWILHWFPCLNAIVQNCHKVIKKEKRKNIKSWISILLVKRQHLNILLVWCHQKEYSKKPSIKGLDPQYIIVQIGSITSILFLRNLSGSWDPFRRFKVAKCLRPACQTSGLEKTMYETQFFNVHSIIGLMCLCGIFLYNLLRHPRHLCHTTEPSAEIFK